MVGLIIICVLLFPFLLLSELIKRNDGKKPPRKKNWWDL